jgi:hypothetical protein
MSMFEATLVIRKAIEAFRICAYAFAAARDYEMLAHRTGKRQQARLAFSLLTSRLARADSTAMPSCERSDSLHPAPMPLSAEG